MINHCKLLHINSIIQIKLNLKFVWKVFELRQDVISLPASDPILLLAEFSLVHNR